MAGEPKPEGFYKSIGLDGGEYEKVGSDQISVTKEEQGEMQEKYKEVEVVAENIITRLDTVNGILSSGFNSIHESGDIPDGYMDALASIKTVAVLPTAQFETVPTVKERIKDYAAHDFNNVVQGVVGYAPLTIMMFGKFNSTSEMSDTEKEQFLEFTTYFERSWKAYNLVARAVTVRLLDDYNVVERTDNMKIQEEILLHDLYDVFEKHMSTHASDVTIDKADISDEARNFVAFGHEGTLANAGLNIMSNPLTKTGDIGASKFAYRAFVDEKQLVQEFTDDGKGMNAERLNNMFEKKPTEGAENSQGIGLAYVDNLVRSMGGRIVVDTI
jgi:light-regulated signal transduction histidine kinase (bacteriophytochrome)